VALYKVSTYYVKNEQFKEKPGMKANRFKIIIFYIFFPIILCTNIQAFENIQNTVPVFVSIMPQAYFVERIGGNRVSIDVLVRPGKSPGTYAPTPIQMIRLGKAKLFFRIGVPFEKALISKIKNPSGKLEIVDTREGIHLRRMSDSRHDHEGENDKHSFGNKDPHIWLNPLYAKKQGETIYNALVKVDPAGKTMYRANYDAFEKDMDALHEKLKNSLSSIKGETIFVFHPAFGYFTDAYGLKQMAVEIEGKAPKGKELAMFIKKAKKNNVHVIFVQSQFNRGAAKQIARAISGVVVSLDPLSKDFIKNMYDMTDKIVKALKK